jgi:hypothetical protein
MASLRGSASGLGQQHQHVDVGVREQFAAAVAAHRHQRGAGRHAGEACHSSAQVASTWRASARSSRVRPARWARVAEVPSSAALPSRKRCRSAATPPAARHDPGHGRDHHHSAITAAGAATGAAAAP